MFRLTKFRHYPSTIGNCFCHNLTNRPLPLSHSLYTVLDKMILIKHDFIPLFSSCRELSSECTGLRLTIGDVHETSEFSSVSKPLSTKFYERSMPSYTGLRNPNLPDRNGGLIFQIGSAKQAGKRKNTLRGIQSPHGSRNHTYFSSTHALANRTVAASALALVGNPRLFPSPA